MVSQGTCKLFLYLTVLLGVLLVHSCEGRTWAFFQRQHIDFPKTPAPNVNAYCNTLMQRRGLNRGRCKPTNTFINARAGTVRSICRGVNAGTRTSRSRFPVVECRARGRFPNCNYQGRARTGRVRVGCRRNVPVHYAGLV